MNTKFTLTIIGLILLCFTICGCTQNVATKQFGGVMEMDLPANKKLINITWKQDQIWYLIRDRHADEPVENYEFIEKKYPNLIETAKMRLIWAYFYVCDRLIFDNSSKYAHLKREITDNIRHNMGFILRNKNFTIFRKISAISLLFGMKLYKLCVKLQNRRYEIV